jgi:hypothetical protein
MRSFQGVGIDAQTVQDLGEIKIAGIGIDVFVMAEEDAPLVCLGSDASILIRRARMEQN